MHCTSGFRIPEAVVLKTLGPISAGKETDHSPSRGRGYISPYLVLGGHPEQKAAGLDSSTGTAQFPRHPASSAL